MATREERAQARQRKTTVGIMRQSLGELALDVLGVTDDEAFALFAERNDVRRALIERKLRERAKPLIDALRDVANEGPSFGTDCRSSDEKAWRAQEALRAAGIEEWQPEDGDG